MATKKQQQELNKLLKEWTNILKLNSWDIFAEFGHPEDFATNVTEERIKITSELSKEKAKARARKSDIEDSITEDEMKLVLDTLSEWYPEEKDKKIDEELKEKEDEIIGNVSAGEIQVDYGSGTVLILILDPKDYIEQDFFMEQDVEETLVHELLHLFFYDIDGLSPDSISQLYIEEISRRDNDKNINRPEKLINDMAKILVKLKRAGKK